METQLFTNRAMSCHDAAPHVRHELRDRADRVVRRATGSPTASLQVGDMMAFISYAMQIVMSVHDPHAWSRSSCRAPRWPLSAWTRCSSARSSSRDPAAARAACGATPARGASPSPVPRRQSFHYPDARRGRASSGVSFTATPGKTTRHHRLHGLGQVNARASSSRASTTSRAAAVLRSTASTCATATSARAAPAQLATCRSRACSSRAPSSRTSSSPATTSTDEDMRVAGARGAGHRVRRGYARRGTARRSARAAPTCPAGSASASAIARALAKRPEVVCL